jgi:hypothetical protein
VPAILLLAGVVLLSAARAADADDSYGLTVPPGFRVEQVAGPPLVLRPITADFDEQGRLYVTESCDWRTPTPTAGSTAPPCSPTT